MRYVLPSSASHFSMATFPSLGGMNAIMKVNKLQNLHLAKMCSYDDNISQMNKVGLISYPSCPFHWCVPSPGQCSGQQGISWKAQYLVGSHQQLVHRRQGVWHSVEVHQGGLERPSVRLQVGQPGDLRNSVRLRRLNGALTLRKETEMFQVWWDVYGSMFEYSAVEKHTYQLRDK